MAFLPRAVGAMPNAPLKTRINLAFQRSCPRIVRENKMPR